ncbi:MAG: LEA type 2 family protein [Casimicrobiaceae bacterium]
MKLRSGWLVSVAALALGACASMAPRPLAPEVTLQALTAGAIDGSGAHARLHFAVRNPNAYALGVKNFDYQVWLDDRDVGSGALAQPVILGADAVTAVDVDVRMDLRVMGAALDHALRKGTLAYDIDGVLVLDGGMSLPFRKHGILDTPNGLR